MDEYKMMSIRQHKILRRPPDGASATTAIFHGHRHGNHDHRWLTKLPTVIQIATQPDSYIIWRVNYDKSTYSIIYLFFLLFIITIICGGVFGMLLCSRKYLAVKTTVVP